MVLLLGEEKRLARGFAVKVLDWATMGRMGMGACERCVQVGGLKGVFKALVGKVRLFFFFCFFKGFFS